MEQTSKRLDTFRKILILVALTATTSFGWVVGHIVRFSIPAYQHPPIEEIDPHIKNGYEPEFEGIRRQFVWTGIPAARIPSSEGAIIFGEFPVEQCLGFTYYTSLPAKCHTADGSLVQVGGGDSIVIVPSSGK